MQMTSVILFGLAIFACALIQTSNRTNSAESGQIPGWQKVLGYVAVLIAVLILINPEFLALGLLGDTVFFDALVLFLSLQLQMVVTRVWHCIREVVSSSTRWIRIPSPGMSYLLAMSALLVASVVSTVQKIVHRISS